jgi:superfamily II DNA/RNA helicase
VDIVVATPGRLVDLIERGACSLDQVQTTVIDEADFLADLGFLPVVTGLVEQTAATGQRMLFSATLDRGVAALVDRFLTDPAVHAVAGMTDPVASMDHRVFTLDHDDKVLVAAEVAARPGRTLFFVRTKYGADRLSRILCRSGVDAAAIHGNLNQNQRQRALAAFAAGRTRVLVATDVAARGIHVDGIDLVVHFDPPNDHKDYIHRSGRTARAGAAGTVLALVEPTQVGEVRRLHEAARVQPTVVAVGPGHQAVREVAESGEPIVVRELAARRPGTGRRPTRSRDGGRQPHRSAGRPRTTSPGRTAPEGRGPRPAPGS